MLQVLTAIYLNNDHLRAGALSRAAKALEADPPRIGRAGWQERAAIAALKAAHAALEAEAAEAEQAARTAEATRRKAQAAKAKADLEAAGLAAGGFVLVNNPPPGLWGDWPHWTIIPGPGGYGTFEEAQTEAEARNQRVQARWASFIS